MREISPQERFDLAMNEVVMGMVCDGNGAVFRCGLHPTWTPRVVVPAVKIGVPPRDFRPLPMMTTLHYCDAHFLAFKLADYLEATIRRDIERAAKRRRGVGFRCNFERAWVERMRIDTPEYRAWLASLTISRER